ncbi:MAG: hypothetical protein KY468_03200 [Armatimonadetes bacterium]|nr:hypothetical protein [Armatimonadota bacterium]
MARLAPSKKSSRYFQDPAGHPVYLSGISATDPLLRSDVDDRVLFQLLARHDLNLVHLDLDPLDRDPSGWIVPYKRGKGTGRTLSGFRRFDLTALNPAFWERVAAMVKHAQQAGIYVMLGLFNAPGATGGWTVSAWNPANNVNGDSLGPVFSETDTAPSLQAFASPSLAYPASPHESFVAERQREFLEAAVDAVGEYPNVLFSLGFPGASGEWMRHGASLLHEQTYAPVVLNLAPGDLNVAGPGFEKASEGFLMASLPEDGMVPAERNPLFLFSPNNGPDQSGDSESTVVLRRAAWRAFLQGFQWIDAPAPSAIPDTASHALTIDEKRLRALGGVRRFLRERRVRYWTMQPGVTPEGVSTLIRLEDRHLAFVPDVGTIQLDLSSDRGSYTVAWWNAADEYLLTAGTILGGGMRAFTPPDEGEWVLDLFKKIR